MAKGSTQVRPAPVRTGLWVPAEARRVNGELLLYDSDDPHPNDFVVRMRANDDAELKKGGFTAVTGRWTEVTGRLWSYNETLVVWSHPTASWLRAEFYRSADIDALSASS